ncbi:MAG TPA: hypothetical protein VGX48_04275 [Pyrinomonadaceae bacterium]|jgi:hypothetical protein|nr:hypothetical protein [Pyrinomonadaceae bacterium]
MKNVLRLLILAAAFGVFALPALAQDTAAGGTAATQDNTQAKADAYQKFLELKKGGPAQQKQAYDIGKDYLSKYAATTDDADKKIYDYIQNWVTKYERATVDFNFKTALFPAAGAKPDYAKGFEIGRQLLSSDQDNLAVLLDLSIAALTNAADPKTANEAVSREAVQYVKRATQLIETAGKAPQRLAADGKTMAENWAPFPNRETALGQLYYTHGLLVRTTSPDEAAQLFIKAAQSNTPFKSDPTTYFYLANAYLDGEYKRLIAEYKSTYEGKDITEEMKPAYEALLAKTNTATDRIIDAWARAVALSADKPQLKVWRENLMKQLADVYKQRHEGNEAGLNELIAKVLSTPLPLPGQPVPSAAPASTTGAAATTTTTPKPAATPATAASGTKP